MVFFNIVIFYIALESVAILQHWREGNKVEGPQKKFAKKVGF